MNMNQEELANAESEFFDFLYSLPESGPVGRVWDNEYTEKIMRGGDSSFVIGTAVREGGRTLDLGCGTGWLSEMLARNGMNVDGIDISPVAVEKARSRVARSLRPNAEMNFWVANLDALRMPAQRYDSVVAWDTLHHIVNLDHLLLEASHTLKNKGVFCGYEHIGMQRRNRLFILFGLLAVAVLDLAFDHTMLGNEVRSVAKMIRGALTEESPREGYIRTLGINVEHEIKAGLGKYFRIQTIRTSDSFSGVVAPFVGGRKAMRVKTNLCLKWVDNYLIRTGVLRGSHLLFSATRKTY